MVSFKRLGYRCDMQMTALVKVAMNTYGCTEEQADFINKETTQNHNVMVDYAGMPDEDDLPF